VVGNDDVIGKVDDLIIDASAGKVRYLDVDLDRKAVGLERERHVLVPITNAQLDTNEEEVVLNGLSREALLKLPEYDAAVQAKGYDDTFRSHLETDTASQSRLEKGAASQSHLEKDAASKRLTRSAEELRIGKRMATRGEVRVGKHVETEHVTQSVPLTREEVHVERRPVDRAVGSAAEFRNDEIVVPVMEEEAVVEKHPVVKEEIVISKEPITRHEKVEADVRREEFDVERSSGTERTDADLKGRGGK